MEFCVSECSSGFAQNPGTTRRDHMLQLERIQRPGMPRHQLYTFPRQNDPDARVGAGASSGTAVSCIHHSPRPQSESIRWNL